MQYFNRSLAVKFKSLNSMSKEILSVHKFMAQHLHTNINDK